MSEENKIEDQPQSKEQSDSNTEYDFLSDISAFDDVTLDFKVILGYAQMSIGQFLKITRGSILELNQKLDSDLDILVNNYKVAEANVELHEDIVAVEVKKVYKHKEF